MFLEPSNLVYPERARITGWGNLPGTGAMEDAQAMWACRIREGGRLDDPFFPPAVFQYASKGHLEAS